MPEHSHQPDGAELAALRRSLDELRIAVGEASRALAAAAMILAASAADAEETLGGPVPSTTDAGGEDVGPAAGPAEDGPLPPTAAEEAVSLDPVARTQAAHAALQAQQAEQQGVAMMGFDPPPDADVPLSTGTDPLGDDGHGGRDVVRHAGALAPREQHVDGELAVAEDVSESQAAWASYGAGPSARPVDAGLEGVPLISSDVVEIVLGPLLDLGDLDGIVDRLAALPVIESVGVVAFDDTEVVLRVALTRPAPLAGLLRTELGRAVERCYLAQGRIVVEFGSGS
ncbi:hypothetical protein SK069_13445 [Patulibacter brassicae]|uniref:Uncharacterized protein n=1 Tax=Patulibacter brassicae TaxID=1705717 RepID=A0ABU4VL83_9ACTN|nr:hypothetical protein [Patulibacter brassicae]MDX8152604.1 hypothetical protein [Patulibacter brassicae]